MSPIVVVGAVIVRDGLILAAQRGEGRALPGLWEFPGGKVEPGEAPEECLRREVWEELGCRIKVGAPLTRTLHRYSFGWVDLATYWCTLLDGEPSTTEHAALLWATPGELAGLEWAPADLPAVAQISSREAQPSSRSSNSTVER